MDQVDRDFEKLSVRARKCIAIATGGIRTGTAFLAWAAEHHISVLAVQEGFGRKSLHEVCGFLNNHGIVAPGREKLATSRLESLEVELQEAIRRQGVFAKRLAEANAKVEMLNATIAACSDEELTPFGAQKQTTVSHRDNARRLEGKTYVEIMDTLGVSARRARAIVVMAARAKGRT